MRPPYFRSSTSSSPLVIVDESHHARSELSLEMLKNFNPCFVLDLTATPKKESNIISYVDAVQLKKENMVKLPVIVYNRDNQGEVLTDAIDLRNGWRNWPNPGRSSLSSTNPPHCAVPGPAQRQGGEHDF